MSCIDLISAELRPERAYTEEGKEGRKKEREMLMKRDRNAPRHQKTPGRRGRARMIGKRVLRERERGGT